MAEQMDIDAPPANGKEAASDRTETLANSGSAAVRSIEGWILIASNLHEEASEEDLQDFFAEFGDIKTITMSMDKRTGYTKVCQQRLRPQIHGEKLMGIALMHRETLLTLARDTPSSNTLHTKKRREQSRKLTAANSWSKRSTSTLHSFARHHVRS